MYDFRFQERLATALNRINVRAEFKVMGMILTHKAKSVSGWDLTLIEKCYIMAHPNYLYYVTSL